MAEILEVEINGETVYFEGDSTPTHETRPMGGTDITEKVAASEV